MKVWELLVELTAADSEAEVRIAVSGSAVPVDAVSRISIPGDDQGRAGVELVRLDSSKRGTMKVKELLAELTRVHSEAEVYITVFVERATGSVFQGHSAGRRIPHSRF